MEHTFLDKYSDLDSPIHRLDPRVKIVLFFLLLVFILGERVNTGIPWFKLASYFLIIGVLVFLSRVPFSYVLRRSLVILPFVLLLVLFNLLFGRWWVIGVFLKSWLAILILILLSATTKFSLLLKGLEKLHLPKIFGMLLSFMYRYIFVLADEIMRMERSWSVRHFRRRNLAQIKVFANVVGLLFIRSYERAERVYAAMCSRGFQGKIETLNELKIKSYDLKFTLVFLGAILLLKVI